MPDKGVLSRSVLELLTMTVRPAFLVISSVSFEYSKNSDTGTVDNSVKIYPLLAIRGGARFIGEQHCPATSADDFQ